MDVFSVDFSCVEALSKSVEAVMLAANEVPEERQWTEREGEGATRKGVRTLCSLFSSIFVPRPTTNSHVATTTHDAAIFLHWPHVWWPALALGGDRDRSCKGVNCG